MNKVLVTGIALGKEAGATDAPNFDLSWVIKQPSVFIWADKIVLTPFMWEIIQSGKWKAPQKFIDSTRLLFSIAESNGLIELLDPSQVINESLIDSICRQVDEDMLGMVEHFPGLAKVKKLGEKDTSPSELSLGEIGGYCTPYVWSIYAALVLAKAWGATCLFNDYALNYCKFKFGLSRHLSNPDLRSIDTFSTVFTPLLPNEPILPEYAYESPDRCSVCQKDNDCEKNYLSQLETRATQLMRWRDYDEVHEVKKVISGIIEKRDLKDGTAKPQDLIREFREQEELLRGKICRVFPKLTRWANLATMVSVPIAVTGLATQAPLLTLSGAGLAGAATVLKEGIGYMKSKYQWVTFLDSARGIRK